MEVSQRVIAFFSVLSAFFHPPVFLSIVAQERRARAIFSLLPIFFAIDRALLPKFPAGILLFNLIRILESALKKVITDPGFGKTLFNKLGMAPAFSSREEIWEEWQDTYRRFSNIVVELRKAEKEFKELQKKK